MKRIGRRNLATLIFIAVLAVVYLLILALRPASTVVDFTATTSPADSVAVATARDAAKEASDTLAADGAGNPDKDTVAVSTGARGRKATRKSRTYTPKPPAKDNPDIFDRPVPMIER